jgi:glycosyltransferase involved in cell wall biosynthesis
MRILHVGTDSFGGYGGIALYNRDLMAAMSTHPSVEEIVVLPRLIVDKSGERQPLPPKVTFVERAARGKLAYVRALRALGKRFDLVICAHANLISLARLVSPHPLLFVYGIEAWKPPRNALSNRLIGSIRGVVSISQITLDRFAAWSRFTGPSHILPNAIHAQEYGIRRRNAQTVKKYGLEGKRVLLTLGRVSLAEQYKGFDEVIEVLPELDGDVVYVIAGGGDGVRALERKAAALGLADRVVFTGKFAESEKADLYGAADVYVMPSRGEGFGFVFLEALASGLPVIGSRLDGGREALRFGALGTLVDPANPAEIRTAIRDTLAAPPPRRVPEGLQYFAFANFERRVHDILTMLA